jgi:hypothetical protein
VEVKIGVTHANRELTLESSLGTDEIQAAVQQALSEADGMFTMTDDKGRTVFVPASKLAYVEISGDSGRKMGFAAR